MTIEIGKYLNYRLAEMGIAHVFGVAGDFNLSYLEQIIADEQLQFIGNCNELNGAYAADGYARSNGFSALVTTYGVGDLSAINGIAGAYAENVPVIHISGIPPLHAVNRGELIHHTLVDGNYQNIMNCMREFTVAQTRLTPENAGLEIDRVLKACFLTRKPVYIQLPSDITHLKIKAPKHPLDLSYPIGDPDVMQEGVKVLSALISKAKSPVLLIDNEAHVFSVTDILMQLSKTHHIPYVCLSTAKNIMDESSPFYAGVYSGAVGDSKVRELVEGSDCLIGIGVRFSDAATGFFTHDISLKNYLSIAQYDINTPQKNFPGLDMAAFLTALNIAIVREKDKSSILPSHLPRAEDHQQELTTNEALTHHQLWGQIASFLKEGDVILGEVGTSNSGLSGILLPKGASYLSQPLWGSIGYTLPALLGSMFAAPTKRHLLFIGDGSLQLTVQELSTIIRHGLKPIIFILNNGGYTIERLILGEKSLYNDIQNWKYQEIAPVFNGSDGYQSFQVKTGAELNATLDAIQDNDVLTVIELMLDPMDAPESLKVFGEVVGRYDYGDKIFEALV